MMAIQLQLTTLLVSAILQSIRVVDSQCSTTGACADTCGRSGLTCCSCSGGSSLTQTCTCCPRTSTCCRQPTGITVCCPSGSTCSSTGTCVTPSTSVSSSSHTYCNNRAATTLKITVDNVMELYIDGRPITVAHSHDWPTVKSVPLPYNTQVIAVKGTDYGHVAGILASTTDGSMITSAAWKCTANHVPAGNWMTPEYDDRSWPAAVVSYRNLNAPTWGTLSGISTSAWWIWTGRREATTPGFHPVAFCRYRCAACSTASSGKKRELEEGAEEEALEQLSADEVNPEDSQIPSASEYEAPEIPSASEYEDPEIPSASEYEDPEALLSPNLGESNAAEAGTADEDPRWWRR